MSDRSDTGCRGRDCARLGRGTAALRGSGRGRGGVASLLLLLIVWMLMGGMTTGVMARGELVAREGVSVVMDEQGDVQGIGLRGAFGGDRVRDGDPWGERSWWISGVAGVPHASLGGGRGMSWKMRSVFGWVCPKIFHVVRGVMTGLPRVVSKDSDRAQKI